MEINVKDKKISREILKLKNLLIKMNIKLINERNDGKISSFHSSYKVGDDNFISVDIQPFITLEIKDREGWNKYKSIIITQKNIYQLIKGFKQLIDNIINGEIFAAKRNGEVIAYGDKIKENTVHIYNLGGTQKLQLQPGVIYDDEDDLTYEGAVAYFNKSDFYAQLTIDDIDAIYYTLNNIDMYAYSQSLLNYYVSTLEKMDVQPIEIRKKKKNPFLENSVPKEEIKSTQTPNDSVSKMSDEDFFGVKNL